MNDIELKQLAVDIYDGAVFTSNHCNNEYEVGMCFMCVMFLDAEQLENFKKEPPGLIYEYMSKAGPRSINGKPMFLSMCYISKDDAVKMWKYYEEYETLKKSFINNETKKTDPEQQVVPEQPSTTL